ncbi:MAG TPA: hypothetical protein VGS27_26565 [Candidatus Sulfotelmatobacter sp.]|nr:hypothetical protein [Candidatus Sulfotelmatobacter sp.]
MRTEPPRAPEPRRSAPTTTDDSPSISGPSFLGLNAPPPARDPRKRVSLSIDPHNSHPGNVDYLLEDDEEPRRSGAWKYVLILIALALAVGFGYLRWKNQGLAWLMPAKKPAVTTTNTTPADTSTPAATPSITPDTQPAPASQPAAGTTTPAPDANAAANTAPSAATPPINSAAPAASTPVPANTDATKPAGNAAPAATPDKSLPEKSTPASSDSSANSAKSSDDAGSEPAEPPKPAVKKEPVPKPRPSIPVDTVAEARKYLYGTGAAQDCDRGLRLLKPAANQGNAKAMVEMGALYSAGLCTPHDLPTAYRWFALALRKEPDNTAVQSDLQKLWSEMTQPERQLAIKLSQ